MGALQLTLLQAELREKHREMHVAQETIAMLQLQLSQQTRDDRFRYEKETEVTLLLLAVTFREFLPAPASLPSCCLQGLIGPVCSLQALVKRERHSREIAADLRTQDKIKTNTIERLQNEMHPYIQKAANLAPFNPHLAQFSTI